MEIKKLTQTINGATVQFYPITHEDAVVNTEGVSVGERLRKCTLLATLTADKNDQFKQDVTDTINEKFALQQNIINSKQLQIGAAQTDLEPTANSANYVASGSLLLVPFDVSSYNNRDYSTLQDAINGIPQSRRRAGMTITYTTSTTRKYAHNISKSYSSDANNWQEISNIIEAGSNNISTSNAVYNNAVLQTAEIQRKLWNNTIYTLYGQHGLEPNDIKWAYGYIDDVTGEATFSGTDKAFTVTYIPVINAHSISTTLSDACKIYVYSYAIDGSFIQTSRIFTNDTSDELVTLQLNSSQVTFEGYEWTGILPTNTAFIRICIQYKDNRKPDITILNDNLYVTSDEDMDYTDARIVDIFNQYNKPLFDVNTLTPGYLSNNKYYSLSDVTLVSDIVELGTYDRFFIKSFHGLWKASIMTYTGTSFSSPLSEIDVPEEAFNTIQSLYSLGVTSPNVTRVRFVYYTSSDNSRMLPVERIYPSIDLFFCDAKHMSESEKKVLRSIQKEGVNLLSIEPEYERFCNGYTVNVARLLEPGYEYEITFIPKSEGDRLTIDFGSVDITTINLGRDASTFISEQYSVKLPIYSFVGTFNIKWSKWEDGVQQTNASYYVSQDAPDVKITRTKLFSDKDTSSITWDKYGVNGQILTWLYTENNNKYAYFQSPINLEGIYSFTVNYDSDNFQLNVRWINNNGYRTDVVENGELVVPTDYDKAYFYLVRLNSIVTTLDGFYGNQLNMKVNTLQNRTVKHISVGQWNVKSWGEQSNVIPENASLRDILKDIKNTITEMNCDILVINEYLQESRISGVPMYDSVFKHFYNNQHLDLDNNVAIFSKYPIKVENDIITTSVDGEYIRITSPDFDMWSSANRTATANNIATAYSQFNKVIVAGTFNTGYQSEASASNELLPLIYNKYVLANRGYWDNISTTTDNKCVDNIAVKGCNIDNYTVLNNTFIFTDHLPTIAKITF